MKKTLLTLTIIGSFLAGCNDKNPEQQWRPIVVKEKYAENQVTKDLVFGTGNWHENAYIILDENNEIWDNVNLKVYLICKKGDTLWVKNRMEWMRLKKDEKQFTY